MKMETRSGMKLLDLIFEIYNAKKRKHYIKENMGLKAAPIVFFGDSITNRCGLKAYYPGVYAINRGISGNTVSDLIDRLEISVCDANPSKIILLIGINDMMNVKRSARDTAERYEILLQMLKEKCPEVPVICQSVYPGYDTKKNMIPKRI